MAEASVEAKEVVATVATKVEADADAHVEVAPVVVSATATPAESAAGCPACSGKHRPHTCKKRWPGKGRKPRITT